MKDMNTNQAKVSVETAKEVMSDKTLRTKGDKDRRLREKKQQNTKKFIEERKTIEIKQGREKEKLKVTHEKQVVDLDKDINTASLKWLFVLNSYSVILFIYRTFYDTSRFIKLKR